MRGKILVTAAILILASGLRVQAQRLAVGTNIADYANLGTVNAEVSYGLSRHWSLNARAAYNPFTYNEGGDRQMQHRLFNVSVGARYWLWHNNSGWFAGSFLKYSVYNYGGVVSRKSEEGHFYGTSLYAGYAIMLSPTLNIEIGGGIAAGVKQYTMYDCPNCGDVVSRGTAASIIPDNLLVQLVYIF